MAFKIPFFSNAKNPFDSAPIFFLHSIFTWQTKKLKKLFRNYTFSPGWVATKR
jgi:hypothetical protein